LENTMPWEYRCEACGHRESLDAPVWRCAACGGAYALDGPNHLAPEAIDRADNTLWRYSAVLPVAREHARSLGEGMTPLVAGTLAGREVWFKHDALLPTGSFKDRGATVLVAHLRRLGLNRVIVDSSGNAAAAMAGYSAAAELDCTVYAPATTSAGKLVQSRAFGATVVLVEGNREAVAQAAQSAAAADPSAFYASHNWHPVFVEGVKTWALEVWEQLGGRNPAAAFVPTGGGSAFVGGWRGFAATGDTPPILIASQPAACAPIVAAHTHGMAMSVTPGTTIAEGTRIAAPSRPGQILAALSESRGHAIAVTEDQLISTLRELWSQGLYVEPTAAVGAAACRSTLEQGQDFGGGPIVVLLTGSGLKATETIATLV
jgi:threonine synthase